MADGYIYDALNSIGDSFANMIKRKRQEDAFRQLQDVPQFNTQYGTVPQGDGVSGVSMNQVPNPDYPNAIAQFLQQSGADPNTLVNMLLAQQQRQMPQYNTVNQEGGGYDMFKQQYGQKPELIESRAPAFRPPTQTPQQVQPTELAKYQNELTQIRTVNPKDPRIPEYEAVIKKLQIGIPNYQPLPTGQGQYGRYNKKTGQLEGELGAFIPSPPQVRQSYSQLNNVSDSIKEIRDIVNKKAITGPVTGRVRKLGSRVFADADATKLINTIGQLRPIIYGLSGKQINEAELEWLNKEILPNIAQPDENFDVTLDAFEKWLNQTKGNLEEQFPSLNQKKGKTTEKSNVVDDPLGILK